MMKMIRKYWIIPAVVILLILLYFILPRINIQTGKIDHFFTIAGWLLFLVTFLYQRSERIYSLINHIRLWLSNEPVNWSFSVEYSEITCRHDIFDRCWELVSGALPESQIWSRTPDTLIVNVSRSFTLRFLLVCDSPRLENTLTIQISDNDKPYRKMRNLLENQIMPLLWNLANEFSGRTKYTARMIFPGINPYFGLYLSRLEIPKVVSFNVEFREHYSNGKQTVIIRKDRVEIVADSILALQNLSLRYLSISSAA